MAHATNLEGPPWILGTYGLLAEVLKGIRGHCFSLIQQLKKDQFKWNLEAQRAFERLKVIMTSTPVLALPDFTQPFEIEDDASGYGLGVVLTQLTP